MSLGERIYRLRIEKNLSQGELAEMLAVSRQSISKWENNNAVPDLEKIVKLSDILGVSLDELVKGENVSYTEEIVTVKQVEKIQGTVNSQRMIIGVILLCMAFVVGILSLITPLSIWGAMLFSLPFLTCGILCFTVKKKLALWCAWDIYVLFDMYMSWATGITRESVLYTLMWTEEMNYNRLVFAWILVLCLGALIIVTAIRFRKNPFVSVQQGKKKMIIAWGIFVILQCGMMIVSNTEIYAYFILEILKMGFWFRVLMFLLSWSKAIALTVAVVYTARFIEMKK